MGRLQRQIVAALRAQLAGGRSQPPEAGIIYWNAFAALSRQRSWHAHGPNPISFCEIETWCRVMRVPLEPRHVQIITAMDAAWMDHAIAGLNSHAKGDKGIPKGKQPPLTAGMFDAMFG